MTARTPAPRPGAPTCCDWKPDWPPSSKQAFVEGNRLFTAHRNPRAFRVVGINDNVEVSSAGDDGRDEKQCGSSIADPIAAKGLSDGRIVSLVPTGVQRRIELFARNIVWNHGFNKSRGTRRRFAIGMHENFEERDGKAGPRIDRG